MSRETRRNLQCTLNYTVIVVDVVVVVVVVVIVVVNDRTWLLITLLPAVSEVLWWACLSVCPSARISQDSRTTWPNVRRAWRVVVARSSSGGVAICYVLPVSWMTSCLPIIGQAKATQIRRLLRMTRRRAAWTKHDRVYSNRFTSGSTGPRRRRLLSTFAECLQLLEILEFEIAPGNAGNLLEFSWCSWDTL